MRIIALTRFCEYKTIPEIVQDRWYNYVLHNQRAAALKAMLYFFGNRQIMVVNVPRYLRVEEHTSVPK